MINGNLEAENRFRLREINMEYERVARRQMDIIREAKERLMEAKNRRNREMIMIEATQRPKGPKITIKN
jgi:plasmid maintenance system killer protein